MTGKAYDDDDFEGTEPELEFTKELDTEIIDGADDEQEYGNKNTRVHGGWLDPILEDQSSRGQLIWRGNDVFAPVGPSEGETEGRVAETGSVARETGGVGEPSSHLAQTAHDNVDQETDQGVGNEDGGRAVQN